jgi:zinc transport system ATP-binding protein
LRDTLVFEMRHGRVALDSTLVLDDIDFRLAGGEFLALLGSNGSGKTTLVRALLGLIPLAAGSIRVFDQPLSRFGQWHQIGYVPQRLTAVSGAPASVMEVVMSGRIGRSQLLRPYRPSDRAAARRALEVLGLAHLASAPITHLSGGQQQRTLIARALSGEPEVLILDEPISGVDLEHQDKLAETLKEFGDGGGSVLLVAHSLGPMEELVTREVVMHAGKVSYDGPHLPHHVHAEHVHHPESPMQRSPLDAAAEGG